MDQQPQLQAQASSLPTLTAFLRPDQRPETHATGNPNNNSNNNHNGEAMRSMGESLRQPMDGTARRHTECEEGPRGRYAHGHEVMRTAYDSHHRQKRRSNLFVQYGEEAYRTHEHHHRVHHAAPQHALPRYARGAYTGQLQQRVPSPEHRHPPSIPEFPGSYDRNSGDWSRGDSLTGPIMDVEDTRPQDAHRVPAVHTDAYASAQEVGVKRERTSRYLSELDRREIISRIDNGEKQVALAKEYQVSRAAVCNLYKNRDTVLNRAVRNPKKAKHPKRSGKEGLSSSNDDQLKEEEIKSDDVEAADEKMSDAHSSTESEKEDTPRSSNNNQNGAHTTYRHYEAPKGSASVIRVFNASAASYPIRRMISVLRNPQLPLATYRQVSRRLVSCLLEEVVACLPRREVNVMTATGEPYPSILPVHDDSVSAVSIETHGSAMLQAFLDIFPGASAGIIPLSRTRDSSPDALWVVENARVLNVRANQSVVLLATACSNGSRVCTALTHLISHVHISPSNIFFATLISSKPGLALVHRQFPGITVISGAIDETLDERGRIRPGIGELSEGDCVSALHSHPHTHSSFT